MKINLGNGNSIILGFIVTIISLVFMLRFGAIGVRTILAITFLFFVTTYILLGKFDVSMTERYIFSIFLGIGIISTLVYFLGLITKFRIAIFIVIALNIVLIMLKVLKKNK